MSKKIVPDVLCCQFKKGVHGFRWRYCNTCSDQGMNGQSTRRRFTDKTRSIYLDGTMKSSIILEEIFGSIHLYTSKGSRSQ